MSASRFRQITVGPCPDCEGRNGRHIGGCTAEADYYDDHAHEHDDVDEAAEIAAMAAVDAYRKGAGPSVLFSK
jgi:hypothetical protein